jgi:hypothetical protein
MLRSLLHAVSPVWRNAQLIRLRWLARDMGAAHPNFPEVFWEIDKLENAS